MIFLVKNHDPKVLNYFISSHSLLEKLRWFFSTLLHSFYYRNLSAKWKTIPRSELTWSLNSWGFLMWEPPKEIGEGEGIWTCLVWVEIIINNTEQFWSWVQWQIFFTLTNVSSKRGNIQRFVCILFLGKQYLVTLHQNNFLPNVIQEFGIIWLSVKQILLSKVVSKEKVYGINEQICFHSLMLDTVLFLKTLLSLRKLPDAAPW